MPGGASEFSAWDIGTLVGETATTFLETPGTFDTEYWYKTTPLIDGAMGCRAFNATGTTFDPHVEVYFGTPGSLDIWFFLLAPDTRPATIPTIAGETLYIRVFGSTDLGSPGVSLQVDFYKAPLNSVGHGDLFIPDDTAFEYPESSGEFVGFPGAVLNSSTGMVRRLQIHAPAAESGDVLPDGTVLLDNSYNADALHLLEPSLSTRTIVTPPVAHDAGTGVHCVTKFAADTFLVGSSDGTDLIFWTVDRDGAIGGSTWTVAGNATAIGFDSGIERIYHVAGADAAPVKRYSLSAGVLSDLAAGVSGYFVVEDGIVVVEDGSVLVGYKRISPRDAFIRKYDVFGTVTATYPVDSAFVLDRICRALDSPISFWVWLHRFVDPNETSRFINLTIPDFDTLAVFDAYQSNAGIGPLLVTPPRFGHSFSCPFMQLPGTEDECDCECPPRPEDGGGGGHSGGNEGDDPTRPVQWTVMCDFGGDVPTGINGTDTEDWAA